MGYLYIVSTPIGNLEDISIRAIKTLIGVDLILCEDTRRTGFLMSELIRRYGEQFGVSIQWKPKFFAYYEQIEQNKLPEIMSFLKEGKSLALVSDAGTPLICDPGYKLVQEAIKRHIPVVSIPGPIAGVAALTSSGFPTDKFLFLGYPPERQANRIKLLKSLFQCFKTLEHCSPTFIFYVAPHKLDQMLKDLKSVFGDIEIVITRELTKIHEGVWHGFISQAVEHFSNPKGELVLLFRISD